MCVVQQCWEPRQCTTLPNPALPLAPQPRQCICGTLCLALLLLLPASLPAASAKCAARPPACCCAAHAHAPSPSLPALPASLPALPAIACRLPSIVQYYGAFHDEASLYIVMEHCGGGDLLEKLLRDKRAMNEKRVALEVAQPCLAILHALHDMRIIHRWGGWLGACVGAGKRAGGWVGGRVGERVGRLQGGREAWRRQRGGGSAALPPGRPAATCLPHSSPLPCLPAANRASFLPSC